MKESNFYNIVLKKGDITHETCDAIVNAANSSLMGGGGVDGAIHRAGGPEILQECKKIRHEHGKCPTGQAVVTKAGKLNASWVIHAVGPVWREGEFKEKELLASAYTSCLQIAEKVGAKVIAFPSISTGIYGFPVAEAAKISLNIIKNYLMANQRIKEIRFILFDDDTLNQYQHALNSIK